MAFGKIKVDTIISTSEELTLPTSVGTDGQVLGVARVAFEPSLADSRLFVARQGSA